MIGVFYRKLPKLSLVIHKCIYPYYNTIISAYRTPIEIKKKVEELFYIEIVKPKIEILNNLSTSQYI